MPEITIKATGPRAAGKTVALREIIKHLTSKMCAEGNPRITQPYELVEDNTDTRELDEHFIRLRWEAPE